jgi:hypothetical protein
MANVFENVDDVYKLGGDNLGSNISGQLGEGGHGSNPAAHVAQEGIAAALGGDVLQSSKQLTTGGTVGDTESNQTSVVVLNIT